MTTITVPWGAWYYERRLELPFPDTWDTQAVNIRGQHALSQEALVAALESPVGAARLRDLARGRRDAVIALDDISRPTPGALLLPLILRELEQGGLPPERVRVVIASGGHRPAVLMDLEYKLGPDLVRALDVHVHNPYEGLATLGQTSTGIPVYINRVFAEGDLKIALGGITPHESVGFGGGRKTVAVGLAGLETLSAFHRRDKDVQTGHMHGNPQHDNLVEIARCAGLEYVVNVLFTPERGIAALVAGDPVAAHEAGVERARELYATPMPAGADVVVLNAYPKDTDLLQSCMVVNVTLIPNPQIVKPDGTVVITTACSEGVGLHFIAGHNMRMPAVWPQSAFGDKQVFIVSPNLSHYEVRRHFPYNTTLYATWDAALQALVARHGAQARAVVYPNACLHLPEVSG